MTNLSDLFPTNTSPIKSKQSGFVSTSTLSTGTGEDGNYLDVTISAVADINKVDVSFAGAGTHASTASNIALYWYNPSSSGRTSIVTARLTSPTNLRLSIPAGGGANLTGRWTVVEYT